MTTNGLVAANRFDTPTTRHLMQLWFAAEGAGQTAQAAVSVAQAAQARFREALLLACDQLGVQPPTGKADTMIDWRTGEFSFEPKED